MKNRAKLNAIHTRYAGERKIMVQLEKKLRRASADLTKYSARVSLPRTTSAKFPAERHA